MSPLDGSQIAHLLSQARRRDDGAVGELLRVYQSYVQLLAQMQMNRQLQGKVSPSDIAQEALLEARRCFPQFQGTTEGELVVWLRRICVALKVLPFAAVLDQRQLQRFNNEAQAAATLHHTNIVPVFGVGCERSVHYYAMQYIAGHTLADVIHDLRIRDGLEEDPGNGHASGLDVTDTLTSVNLVEQPKGVVDGESHNEHDYQAFRAVEPATSDTQREARATLSTHHSRTSQQYYNNVAELGIQVAEALQHAHEAGVIHRDIKPSNLILDAQGKVWVTDFGLARVEGNVGLTITGDLIGTLRYMSPEQAMAKRVLVDDRTDIYSLGVTLYELLTLQPAYKGKDRQELLRQIAFEEPRSPRRVNKSIPAELETIVLKAVEKNPVVRYQTAATLAADLRRYLENKPILAKPPSLVQRLRKWSQRHPTLVASAVVVLLLAVVGLTFHTVALSHERDRAVAQKEEAEEQREKAKRQLRQATSLRLAAQSETIRIERPIQSLLLAKRSIKTVLRYHEPIPAFAQQSLRDALAAVGGRPFPQGQPFVSANNRWLGLGDQGTVYLYDLQDPWSNKEVVVRDDPDRRLAAVSSDRKWVITHNLHRRPHGTLHLWNLHSKDPRIVLPAGEGKFYVNRISPDSRWLAVYIHSPSGESTGVIQLWDLNAPDISGSLKVLRGVRDWPWVFDFSPDSRWLASGTPGHVARMWDLRAPDPSARTTDLHLGEQELGVWSLAFSPDGRALVAGTVARDRVCSVRMWNLTAPDPNASPVVFPGHDNQVEAVNISPDGRWLVTIDTAAIRLWDLERAEPNSAPIVWRGHVESALLAAFSPDSRRLVTFSRKTARIWDLTARDPSAYSVVLRGHEFAIKRFYFTPDGRWMITRARGENRRWDLSSHAMQMKSSWQRNNDLGTDPLVIPDQDGRQFGFLRDGSKLYTTSTPDTVRLWDLSAKDPRAESVIFPVDQLRVVSFSTDNRWLATGSNTGAVRLWDLNRPDPEASPLDLKSHNDSVTSIRFSRDNRWLATGSKDRTVRVWNLSDEELTSDPVVLRGFEKPGGLLQLSPDGRWLARVDNQDRGASVRVYDLATSSLADSPFKLSHPHKIEHIAFSPDSGWLAIGGDNEAQLWNLRGVERPADPYVLAGHENPIGNLRFSPNSRWLATGSWKLGTFSQYEREGSVRLWDLSDEHFVTKPYLLAEQLLFGGQSPRNGDPFAADSTWLATVGLDHSVHLWDLSVVNPAARSTQLRGHTAMPQLVAFSPDGCWLATSGEYQTSGYEPNIRLSVRPDALAALFPPFRAILGRSVQQGGQSAAMRNRCTEANRAESNCAPSIQRLAAQST